MVTSVARERLEELKKQGRRCKLIYTLSDIATRERLQYTPGPNFFANGSGERFIRLAYSYESPQRCYEGSRRLAEAILEANR